MVDRIVPLPSELQECWKNIPAVSPAIAGYLKPIQNWLIVEGRVGDYVLVQGDFGACYLLVRFALSQGLIPVYSTTQREAEEEILPDGTVRLIHHFEHQIFRRYGE
jgi:hypothetical protein